MTVFLPYANALLSDAAASPCQQAAEKAAEALLVLPSFHLTPLPGSFRG
jgi:hypothetical protein